MTTSMRFAAVLLAVGSLLRPCGAADPPSKGLAPIELTLVDGHAIAFGTFQSHNQKIVSNDNGIFMTHVRQANKEYTAQTWRLSRSTDGGKSFATVYEAINACSSPALETDVGRTRRCTASRRSTIANNWHAS